MYKILIHINLNMSHQKIWEKVQASVAAEQGQQWCMLWLSQLRQFIQQLYNEEHVQHIKNIALHVATSTQSSWKDIQLYFQNTQYNTIELCRQFGTLYASKGMLNPES